MIEEALGNAGMDVSQVDWLLLHQANIRIMDVVADRLGLPAEKVGDRRDHSHSQAGRQAGPHLLTDRPPCLSSSASSCVGGGSLDPDEPEGLRQHERRLHPPGPRRGSQGRKGQRVAGRPAYRMTHDRA